MALFGIFGKSKKEPAAQEAEQKLSELTDLPIIWHFIGRVQRNR